MEVRQRKNAQRTRGNISSSSSPDNGSGDDSYNNEKKTYNKSTSILKNSKYDEYAWFVIFLTALTYFIYTRGGNNTRGGLLSSFSKPYTIISSSISVGSENINENEKLLKSIFYVANTQQNNIQQQEDDEKVLTLEYNRRLEVILTSPSDTYVFHDDDKECISSTNTNDKQQQQSVIPYLSHLSSTTWVHDEELGRGYLLLADVGRSGRIWRWEVGGGPITIGRSLHMERSGCRSGLWISDGNDTSSCPVNLFGDSKSCVESAAAASSSTSNLLGSASLAVELTRNADRASAGQNIIVAEWGERRIVRVEHESGARTPIVTVVPTGSQGGEKRRRVFQPNHLMYTPFGDLLFSDNFELDDDATNNSTTTTIPIHAGAVYRKKEAVHIPAIPVEQSRDAHSWMGTTPDNNDDDKSIDILFKAFSGIIEGMALGLDYSTLYVLVTTEDSPSSWMKTVYKLSLGTDEDDDEDDDSDETSSGFKKGGVSVLYQMSSTDCKEVNDNTSASSSTSGSKLAVDEKGTIYMITCPTSLTLLRENGSVVGTLALDNHLQQKNPKKQQTTMPFTSVGFGEDGYLYITSANELMRVKSRIGGLSLPTNMVVPPPLKKM